VGMLPLYAARIADLGLGDFVKVDCAACPPCRAADAGGAAEAWQRRQCPSSPVRLVPGLQPSGRTPLIQKARDRRADRAGAWREMASEHAA
jgi:hypothetical protein